MTTSPMPLASLPEDIPTFHDAQEVCYVIRGESSNNEHGLAPYLTYEDYTIVRARVQELFGANFDPCFCPRLFLKATVGRGGRLSEEVLCRYVREFARQERQRWELEQYDKNGTGMLSTSQVEEYVKALRLFQRQGAPESTAKVGDRMGVLKAVFYHANRNGLVRISDLVHGQAMAEIGKVTSVLDDEEREAISDSSWFSKQNVMIISTTFHELNQSKSGWLSQAEFASYQGAKMTPFFVDRIFEEYGVVKMGKPAMDIDIFTTFVLAWRDRSSLQAIRYLFQIYDIQKQGFLTSMNIFTFVRHIIADFVSLEPAAYYPKMVEDVVNEVFDIVKPKCPWRITIKDLLAVENAGVVFGILGDAWEFYNHEHKEDQQDQQDNQE